MKHTMQFSVGDEVVSVPQNEMDEFNSIAKQNNVTPEPIFSYRVSGKDMEPQEVEVPKSQYDEFAKVAADNGAKIEPLRHIVLDDGTEKTMSMRELRDFMRSDEYLNTPEGQVAAARRRASSARLAYEEKRAPGFWGELARGLFTAEGIRENAENSALAKPYAYANDLCNAIVGGLLKGSAKISEGFGIAWEGLGNALDNRGMAEAGRRAQSAAKEDQAAVDQALPTDMLDTSGGGAVNKVLQVGKNVAAVTGEFAPAAIPGVGQAYAASLVGGGATVRFAQVYDDAIEHGVDPQRAVGLASLGAGVDALGNMLLMGKFKGVWSGEEKALADAAKRSLVRRLVGDTAKTGAIMSGQGMAGDVIDQAAEGNVWLDWKRTGKVGFEQFIEGGLFHLVNSGAHAATRIDWGREAKGIPDGAARDMMEAPEGRALIFANSPDAARSVFHARRRGEDVSRRMIRELGLPDSIARTVHERNAIGDRLMADYDAFKERVRTKMDDVQAEALADEIASRSDEGVNNPAFEKVWFKAVEQIKDATELDDPERRAAIVDEAVKSNLGKGEKLRLAKQVLEYNRQRQAEFEAERAARAEAEKSISGQPEAAKPVIEAKIDPHGPNFDPETGAEAPAGAEKPVQPPEVAANPARGASVEGNPTNDTPPAPSAPTTVPVRPTASVPAETLEAAPKNPVEGVSDVVAAQKHLTADGDLKDGDISAPVGQQIKVGDTQFKVEARDEASGTLTVSDADGGRYEISENGEVKEVNHGSDQGGSPESAGARAQETARVEAAQGNGEAGTDGNQGQADGGAPGAKGGGTDVGGVKVSKTVTDVKPANTKADPKKVAKVAEKFNLHLTKAETEKMSRSKNGINTNLMKTYHDPDGHLVATDGRILISTTHGFDKAKADADKASGRTYPNWRHVVPDYDTLSNRSQVNPKAILAVAKEATKLARDTGNDPDRVFVRVKVGDNDCLLAAFNATKMAEAMDAAGMTELATDARKDYPVVAHSKTTDIVLMPFRISNAWDNDIVIDAQTGRLVHAPKFDRDEKTGRTFEENALDVSMKQRGTMRSDLERQIKDSDVYADILAVRSGEKTADQAAKDSLKGVADSELSSPRAEVEKARAEHYARFAAIKDDAELMNALHDYYRGRKSIDNDNWRRNERDIEKFTKHVAAVKRIEELRDAEPEQPVHAEKPEPKPVEKPTEAAAPVEDADYKKWLNGLKDTPKRRAEYEKSHKAEAPAKEPEVEFDRDSVVLSADEVRKTMPGYNPKDWRTHVDKTGFVGPRMEAQFQHLLKTRKNKGNGHVAILAGGNGSGKSTVTSKLADNYDFTIDSTLGNIETARKQIKSILANGQKPNIIYVYRDPMDALNGVIERAENGGHIVSPLSFANSHTKARENLRLLIDEFGDKISATIYDNSVEGAPQITLEQFEKKAKVDHAELRRIANERIGAAERVVAGEAGLSRPVGAEGSGGKEPPAKGGEEVSESAYKNWIEGFGYEDTPEHRDQFKKMVAAGRADPKTGEPIRPEIENVGRFKVMHTNDETDETEIVDRSNLHKSYGTFPTRAEAMKWIENHDPEIDREAEREANERFIDGFYHHYNELFGRNSDEYPMKKTALMAVENEIENAKARIEEEMDRIKGRDDSKLFQKNADALEVLKSNLEAIEGIEKSLDEDFGDGLTKSEIHDEVRRVIGEINDISPIPDFTDLGDFEPRRGMERTGVREIDRLNDKFDDEDERMRGVERKFADSPFEQFSDADYEYDDMTSLADEYLGKPLKFDKEVYGKLTDGDKRYFGKLTDELEVARDAIVDDIIEERTISPETSRRFVEAHEAIGAFEESARKYHGLMRDEDGRAVLHTEKAHASAMASDAVSGVAKALAAKNRESGEAAMERMRMAVRNGGEFPKRKEVTEASKLLPDELRKAFVKNMNEWRKWADGLKKETPIADAASKAADDVDAAIEAEERGGATAAPAGAPVAAPRGSGTGTLPQDTPMSLGRGTGKRTIVTPQSFLKEAQRLFPDVAFRQKNTARMKTWAAGHFEPLDRIIRSRDMSAIRTLSHELGHDLEHLTRYDVLKSPAVKRDLSDLGHALYGPGVPKPPSYIGEGFAEYVRGYVCDAPNLHQVAPDLDTWFNGPFKKSHPEIVKKLDRLRDMVQTMKEQSAMEEIRGFRRPATTVVERAWKHVTDVFSGENWNDQASIILHGLKKSGMESLYHWQGDFRELEAAVKAGDAAKAASLAAKVNDKIANHPYLFPTITRGTASQRVMDMARHGTTSLLGNVRTGESLKDIFADFSKKEQEEWKDYAIARHGIANYYDKKLEFGLPREVLEATIRNYAPKAAKYEAALQRFTDYSHRVLHLGVDAGLISQETYDKIVADHPIYVRITRRYNEDGASARQGGGAAINRRTGGFDNILDPIDATLMDQEKYLRACFQAKTLQLIAQAARRGEAANLRSIKTNGGPNVNNTHPHGEAHMAVGAYWPVLVPNAKEAVKFNSGKLGKELAKAKEDFVNRTGADAIPIEEFLQDLTEDNTSLLTIFRDKPSAGKHNLVSVYVDGDLQTYELPDMKWAKMLSDVYDKSEFSKLERGFGLATAGIRLGATTVNPGFAVRNGIRDSLHSAVMSETGAIPMLSTLNGMLHQLTGAESAQMFRSMGGHMSDLVGITKEQKWNHGGKVALAQNPLQTVAAYSPTDWLLMKPVVKAASDILSLPELGPRIREFEGVMQKCRKAGLDEDVCAMLAMSHAKDISIDFQRAGRYMKHINHFIPFSNAMWRGTEQTVRNLGLLPALPHQFEDRNAVRGAKNVGKGLAYVTSWMAALAMMEMSGDEEDKRRAFERSPVEKWEYAHMGDWRVPLPFETGYLFGALPKAVIYEMNGDEGAVKECLTYFNQAMPTKYLNPDTVVGSISLFTPWIGLLRNKDYRGRAIVPEHIMENRIKEDWYTQYTTELSKRLGKELGASPAQLEYLLDAYTGGLYRRLALGAENIGDTSRLKEGRGISILDTLRARPQANRLIEDFYRFGEEAKQRLGSGVISLEDYGKLAAQNAVKKTLTSRFDEMRTIRADKSIPMAEQDRLVGELSEKVNETIREFNGRDDYRQRGIAYAASHLTGSAPDQLKPEDRDQYLALLKDVPRNEIVQALIKFGSEAVMVKSKGVEVPHQRWSNQNINERVSRLLMLMQ